MRDFYVYIVASKTRRLYVGVTSHLERRAHEHKHHLIEGFTRRYNIERLVYYEHFRDAQAAINREKQIKGWLRSRKIVLIEETNPEWQDLSERWSK